MCYRDGLFSTEPGKWTRSELCMTQVGVQDHFLVIARWRPLRCFSSRSLLRMLATIYAYCRCSSTLLQHPFLQASIVLRLLSFRDSQILPNSCRCRWYQCRWRNPARVGARWRLCSIVLFSFQLISSGSQLGRSGSSIRGGLLLFWFHSRTLIVFWMI